MTKTVTEPPSTKTNTVPPEMQISPHDEAEQRKAECEAAIRAVLAKHRCRIVPYLTGEQVGILGTKMLMVAMYGVVPDTAETL